MNEMRARVLARRFMETRMKVPRSDIDGCPVAACPREAFEAELTRLIQRVATEASCPLSILLDKLARIDAESVRHVEDQRVHTN